ncbi:HIT-like domain-containing protein, partial [Mucidula mucida]
MSNLAILRTYASKSPADFPPTILFGHTSSSLTIYDAFPKSLFHFLILPRPEAYPDLTIPDLSSLKSLLKKDKSRAEELIKSLQSDAEALKADIESEMVKRYGFKWDIWTGFHGAPSMEHLHLHVLSADLCSERMKNKKHYNSFHPKLGFFLDINEVVSWFEAEPSYYSTVHHKQYEAILKEPLSCFHCRAEQKNMPTLKAHLQEEFD